MSRPQTNHQIAVTLGKVMGNAHPLTNLLQHVGDDLRALRLEAALSQRALAEEMGTAQAQIARIEAAQTVGLSLRSVVAFAEALGFRTVITFEPEEQA